MLKRVNAETQTILNKEFDGVLCFTNYWAAVPTTSGISLCSFSGDQQMQIGSDDFTAPRVSACFVDNVTMSVAVSSQHRIMVYPVQQHASTGLGSAYTINRKGIVTVLPLLSGFAAFSDRGIEVFAVSYTDAGAVVVNSYVAVNFIMPAETTRLMPGPLNVHDGFDKYPCHSLSFAAAISKNVYVYQHPSNFMVVAVGISVVGENVPKLEHGLCVEQPYLVCDATERVLAAILHNGTHLLVATTLRVYRMAFKDVEATLPYTDSTATTMEHRTAHPASAAFQIKADNTVALHCDNASTPVSVF